jgi:hypothetical protein
LLVNQGPSGTLRVLPRLFLDSQLQRRVLTCNEDKHSKSV